VNSTHHELIVIGAGAGGLNAARRAAQSGREVLLVERARPGGECTWAGCIPSKALIRIAETYHSARRFGVSAVDGQDVMRRVRELTLTAHRAETVEMLEAEGITYLHGAAVFLDPRRIVVDGRVLTADHVILSTGSRPARPPIEGLDAVEVLTNANVFELDTVPRSMIVLGAGAIGVELSQAFARLGTDITLVEMAPSILPREDPEQAAELASVLHDEGVEIRTRSRAVRADPRTDGVAITVDRDGAREILVAEHVLVALGRTPNLEGLGLAAAGVRIDKRGVPVNGYMQTNVPHIYAVGDIVGPYQFSHMAGAQARTAVDHLLGLQPVPMTDEHAWCTFTHPEFARTGLAEHDVRAVHGDDYVLFSARMSAADRAVVDERTIGSVKVLCTPDGLILGASILGARAGELLGELQILKTLGEPIHRVFDSLHPYPGYGEVLLALEPASPSEGALAPA